MSDVASALAPPAARRSAPRLGTAAGSRALLLVFSALVILLVVGLAALLIAHLRAAALADAETQVVALGDVLLEQTTRTLQSVDLALDLIEERLQRQDQGRVLDPPTLRALLNGAVAGLPQVKQVALVRADGAVVAGSRGLPVATRAPAGRQSLLPNRDWPVTGLRIGEPVRAGDDWLIPASRRLSVAGGFVGDIDVDLDAGYFESVYRAAVTEGMAITLFRDDAVLLARHPSAGIELGARLVDGRVFRRLAESGDGGSMRAVGRLDGEPRIFAPRRVAGYPLVIIISISERVVLEKWRRQALFIGIAAIAASLAVIGLMVLLRASELRVRQHAALLQDAVDALPEGFVLYDPHDRLVLTNRRFRELRPRDPRAFEPGVDFESILRIAIEGGELVLPPGADRETWIRDRLAVHRQAQGEILREGHGRVLRISERRTRDGGIVGIHADITELTHARSEVETTRARQADWAEASSDWFWETDAEHRFTFVSDSIRDATGVEPARLIGRHVRAVRGPDDDPEAWEAHLVALMAHRPFRDVVVSGRHPAGWRYYVGVSGKPVFDGDGVFRGYRGTGRDVTVQREAEQALARQTSILSTLIENLPVGVNLVDGSGRFVAVNRPFLTLYGLEPAELSVGDPFERFIRALAHRGEYGPGDVEAQVAQGMARAFDPRPSLFERRRPDGQVVEIRRVPLPGGGFVTSYIDVSDARHREADLEETRARLERQAEELIQARVEAEQAQAAADAASRAKSLFLANMSHELRTPLNAILGFSEVMRDAMLGPLAPRYRDYASEIHASGQYLLRLINDVLDTSRIEIDRLELAREPVDVADVARECERLLRDKAEAGGLTLALAVPAGLPPIVADRLRIKQVVLNLLSNAIKFTPSGGRVTLAVEPEPDTGIALVIADTGIGMRPEDVPVALEPFRQVDNLFSRRYEGTGLGLPLAKALTELHGGRLTIDSRPGEGTTVRVILPAGDPPA